MLPEKLHIQQIERFHRTMKDLAEIINTAPDEEKQKMSLKYFRLTELGRKLDDFVEFTLKSELDWINQEF